jgi:hypothetical protein
MVLSNRAVFPECKRMATYIRMTWELVEILDSCYTPESPKSLRVEPGSGILTHTHTHQIISIFLDISS